MDPKSFRKIAVFVLLFLLLTSNVFSQSETGSYTTTFHYSGAGKGPQTLTIDFEDEWLLRPDSEYNHKLMQASFGLASAGFRDKEHDLSRKDYNIRDFFSQLEFRETKTEDFNIPTSINTIGTAIAMKKIGDVTVIAVSVSGNNYQNEWQSNLTLDANSRPEGFNNAAKKVWNRLTEYIEEYGLSGEKLRLWISGYSRAAAVSNIVAADATDSGMFDAVFGYTVATPRTTNDENAGRYSNIYNVINPFDPVPMVPFPEWGYVRYGTDLFLPSQETDSNYAKKKAAANEYCMKAYGHQLHYNPMINSQLHTILDFTLFFVNSAQSYKETFQTGIVDVWKSHNPQLLLQTIIDKVSSLPTITEYQFKEFFEFLDFMMQAVYTNFRNQKLHIMTGAWNPKLSIQENVMHEHYDEPYRSWLFSSDDPDDIFMNDPSYIHYSVWGDVDVQLVDEEGKFIALIEQSGNILTIENIPEEQLTQEALVSETGEQMSPADLVSDTELFAIRQDEQTLIVFPKDRNYLAVVMAHQDEDIKIGYVEYSAKNVRGDVQYVLDMTVHKNEGYYGNINPEELNDLSDDELLTRGFRKVEPWSHDVVYSPSAVMRLENNGIFHPSPAAVLTFAGLGVAFILYLVVLGMIGTGNGIKKGVRAVRSRIAERRAGIQEPAGSDQRPESTAELPEENGKEEPEEEEEDSFQPVPADEHQPENSDPEKSA